MHFGSDCKVFSIHLCYVTSDQNIFSNVSEHISLFKFLVFPGEIFVSYKVHDFAYKGHALRFISKTRSILLQYWNILKLKHTFVSPESN